MASQNEIVLSHLQTHKGITSMDAFQKYSITRLSGRIFDLREKGHNIVSVDREGTTPLGHKCKFTEYRLVK